jgi:hypothetical protein
MPRRRRKSDAWCYGPLRGEQTRALPLTPVRTRRIDGSCSRPSVGAGEVRGAEVGGVDGCGPVGRAVVPRDRVGHPRLLRGGTTLLGLTRAGAVHGRRGAAHGAGRRVAPRRPGSQRGQRGANGGAGESESHRDFRWCERDRTADGALAWCSTRRV